jgi:PAS domain S-box-containing protein
MMKRKETVEEFEQLADGVFVVDRELKIIAFSEGAERITGYRREEVIGKHCPALFRSQNCEEGCPAKATLATGEMLSNCQYTIFTKDDDEIPICLSTAPLKDKEGKVTAVVGTFRNLAEVRNLIARLSVASRQTTLAKNKLQAIMNSINDGVFTVDEKYHLTAFNRAAQEITRFSEAEVLGKPCREVFRSSTCREECPLRKTMRTGHSVTNFELEILTRRNSYLPISVSTALLKDEAGKVIGGVETFRDMSQIKQLTEELAGKYSFGNIIGKSYRMQGIYKLVTDVAVTTSTVLIEGETGTGKELVARAIHYHSPRREYPFITVSCAALPETLLESELFGHVKGAFTGAISDRKGRFESAAGGTVFLDEIGEISPAVQVKLLRVLESQQFERVGETKTIHVDIRLIAATNQTLLKKVEKGEFRQDLYYRLNIVRLKLPPLRERREDIPLLLEHFITLFNKRTGRHVTGISLEAMNILVDHPWPGNVRQLENSIEHAFIHCRSGLIQPQHLPEELGLPDKKILARVSQKRRPLAELERELIIETLAKHKGNRTFTARDLGISRSSLWRKMKKHNIPSHK